MKFRKLLLIVLPIVFVQQLPEIIWFATGDKTWLEKKEKYLSFDYWMASKPAPITDRTSALNTCWDWKFPPEIRIDACTYLIEEAKVNGTIDPAPYSGRANSYSLLGAYDKAIKDYDEAIRLNPADVNYLLHRGSIHKLNRDWEKALVDLDVVVGAAPTWSNGYYTRATIYADKGEIDRAILDAEQALKITTDHPQALILRGEMFAKKGDVEKAKEDFDRVIALSSLFFPRAYIGRADLLIRTGNFDQALSELDNALRGAKVLKHGEKTTAIVHANRGKVLEQLTRMPEAIISYQQAYELGHRPGWLTERLRSEGALP